MKYRARILVVEDDAAAAKRLGKSLTSLGYDVVAIVDSGEEAVDTAIVLRPDLILMDVAPKGLDGISAAGRIHAEQDTPVVYLTPRGDDDTFSRAKAANGFAYLVKPFRPGPLRHCIELALHKCNLERSLRKDEARYHTFFDTAGSAILIVEEHTVIAQVNEEFERLSGYSRSELEHRKRLTDFFLGQDLEAVSGYVNLMRMVPALAPIHCEASFYDRRGNAREIIFSIKRVPGAPGSMVSIIDTSDWRHVEREHDATIELLHHINSSTGIDDLRQRATTFLAGLLGGVRTGIRMCTANDDPLHEAAAGRLHEFETGTLDLLAVCPDETATCDPPFLESLCGAVLTGCTDPSRPFFTDNGSFWTNSSSDVLQKCDFGGIHRIRGQRDCCGYESIAVIPLRTGGKILGVMHFADQARERFTPRLIAMLERIGDHLALALSHRQADEKITSYMHELEKSRDRIVQQSHELMVAHRMAETANRAKSDFLATMSHEIRTPMTSVIGMADLLMKTELTEQQRILAGGILNSADTLLEIINDILDFSKVESGKVEIKPAPFDLRSLCEEVADLLSPKTAGKQVEIIVNCPPEIPTHLIGDAGRIRQVLVNLAGNAVKFTEKGHVTIEVECSAGEGADPLFMIRVRDTGVGIPDDKIPLLFQKFYRVESVTHRKFAGTGLGLAISKSLVERMGGTIGAHSTAGSGSLFWFELALALDTSYPVVSDSLSGLSGTRVLVVDDEYQNCQMLAKHLAFRGMRCSSSLSGEAALELLNGALAGNDPFRIVLIDQNMPDMDGATLGRIIKEHRDLASTRLILLSADIHRCRKTVDSTHDMFAAFLDKPIRMHGLVKALQAVSPFPQHDDGAGKDAPVTARPAAPFASLRVLLVEDNPASEEVAAAMLQFLGCTADVATSGSEAVEMACRHPYDIVFMDCNMPHMDGFEATAEIRSREGTSRHTVIIALTANAIRGYREKCLLAGMDDYLSKPVRSQELLETLTRWVSPGLLKEAAFAECEPETDVGAGGIFDAERLQKLLVIFKKSGKDLVSTVVEPFLENIEKNMPLLHLAVSEGNFSGVYATAHQLQGGSRNLGLRRVTAICAGIQNSSGLHNHESVRRLVHSLEKEVPLVRRQVYQMREQGLI